MLICPHCYKTRSKKGKSWTVESLANHVKDAHPKAYKKAKKEEGEFEELELESMHSDEPDAAFFAMMDEQGIY